MKRDLNKAIAEGKRIAEKRDGLDLRVPELNQLKERFDAEKATAGEAHAVFSLIGAAYLAGLAIGTRNA